MSASVEKAVKEGRLKFYQNGSYSYRPSKEYLTRFGKKEIQESLSTVIKNSIKKLDALDRAFQLGEQRNKKVSHVVNNKIILV